MLIMLATVVVMTGKRMRDGKGKNGDDDDDAEEDGNYGISSDAG